MELEELSKGKGPLLGRTRIENVFLAAESIYGHRGEFQKAL